MPTFAQVQREIVSCSRCPRLVTYLERISREKVKRYQEWKYWGKPVPSFGDPKAQLLIVGLAPAAHGGNRTGRAFTGDRSADWLCGCVVRLWGACGTAAGCVVGNEGAVRR